MRYYYSNASDVSLTCKVGRKHFAKIQKASAGQICSKGSDHCFIGDLGKIPGWSETHLTSCMGEIIGFHRSLTDEETSHVHEYLMKKWGVITDPI